MESENMGLLLDFTRREGASDMQLHIWADNFGSMSHSRRNLARMLRDLIEEVEKWDLTPEPASLWWTRTYEEEERSEVLIATNGLMYKFPFEEKFKILGCAINRQGKTLDAIEERMQSANKAYWRDIQVHKSKDAPWMTNCRRLVDHVNSVFCFGSENWSWTVQTKDRIKRWENRIMMRLFCFKRKKDETWVEFQTRCCEAARKIWIQMGLPFL